MNINIDITKWAGPQIINITGPAVLVLQQIGLLWSMAQRCALVVPQMSRNLVHTIIEIAINTKIPPHPSIMRMFCHKCGSVLIPGLTSSLHTVKRLNDKSLSSQKSFSALVNVNNNINKNNPKKPNSTTKGPFTVNPFLSNPFAVSMNNVLIKNSNGNGNSINHAKTTITTHNKNQQSPQLPSSTPIESIFKCMACKHLVKNEIILQTNTAHDTPQHMGIKRPRNHKSIKIEDKFNIIPIMNDIPMQNTQVVPTTLIPSIIKGEIVQNTHENTEIINIVNSHQSSNITPRDSISNDTLTTDIVNSTELVEESTPMIAVIDPYAGMSAKERKRQRLIDQMYAQQNDQRDAPNLFQTQTNNKSNPQANAMMGGNPFVSLNNPFALGNRPNTINNMSGINNNSTSGTNKFGSNPPHPPVATKQEKKNKSMLNAMMGRKIF